MAIVLPVARETLGVLRFPFFHGDPFSIWHVALDPGIVPLVIVGYRKARRPAGKGGPPAGRR